MGEPNVSVTLTGETIPSPETMPQSGETGAALIFQGIVRDIENDREIVALFYEAYAEMAAKELHLLCQEASRLHRLQRVDCWHRTGEVPVDEASLQIVIWSHHRESGLEAMAWLIGQIKQSVPIWKWGVTADGERFPSQVAEQHGH